MFRSQRVRLSTAFLTLAGGLCLPLTAHAQAQAPTVVSIVEDPTGGPGENNPKNPVPAGALSGTVVLLEMGDPTNPNDQGNRLNWSDVVQFDGQGNATMVSDVDTPGTNPFANTTLSTNAVFLSESATLQFTFYDPRNSGSKPGYIGGGGAGANVVYNIYSDPTTEAPEPTVVASFSLGLLGLGALRLRARRSGRRVA